TPRRAVPRSCRSPVVGSTSYAPVAVTLGILVGGGVLHQGCPVHSLRDAQPRRLPSSLRSSVQTTPRLRPFRPASFAGRPATVAHSPPPGSPVPSKRATIPAWASC